MATDASVATIRRRWLDQRLEEQRGRCAYCYVKIEIAASSVDRRATVDHVTALARGGADVLENVVAACASCNMAKADMPEAAYRAHPYCIARRKGADKPPDRLASNPGSPSYDREVLDRGVGVRFNGRERTDVVEYCVSGGWIRVIIRCAKDRRGKPLEMKLNGTVAPYFKDKIARDDGTSVGLRFGRVWQRMGSNRGPIKNEDRPSGQGRIPGPRRKPAS